MHRSRFCAFVVDCKTDDLDAAARFWSAALGREVEPPSADLPRYRTLRVRDTDPQMIVQQVDHESRVHIDVESDDVEAEVARLEALGARRVAKVRTWWILQAPTGQRFCVVRPQRGALGPDANVWP